jgi:demethylmenaquinone methyltransferase/2-methoxy-6-polyprenyl-1,4-benzoquinol methylase
MTSDPYERIAGRYDRLTEPLLAGVRHAALETLPPQRGWRVLDIGCGTGTGMAPYLDGGCSVVGVDISEGMLAQAKNRLGQSASLVMTGAGRLPFADLQFDLVRASMVVHEISAPARPLVMAEMARVTRGDGRLLVVDYRFGSLRGWRGPTFAAISWLVERLSGHFDGFRSFKADGGVPALADAAGLRVELERPIGGGNIGIYVISR